MNYSNGARNRVFDPGAGRAQCHGTRRRLCRCAASGQSFLLSLTGPSADRPQCHGTRSRLCRCAASGPSSRLSLTGPGAARPQCLSTRYRLCRCAASASAPFFPSVTHRAGCGPLTVSRHDSFAQMKYWSFVLERRQIAVIT